jgi:membrane-associated phospholipid phosphatase
MFFQQRLPKTFLYLCAFYLMVCTALVLLFNKGEVEFWVNQHYTTFFNYFFSITTHYGDGLIGVLILALLIVFVSIRDGLSITFLSLILSAIVQSMKHLWFGDIVRPKLYLKDLPLNYVPGIEIHSFNSFPSGHTAQAFLLSFVLSQLIKAPQWAFVFFCIAVFTAMSRVYLLQHFVVDVYAGAIASLICCVLYWKWVHVPYVSTRWESKPLIKF